MEIVGTDPCAVSNSTFSAISPQECAVPPVFSFRTISAPDLPENAQTEPDLVFPHKLPSRFA